MLDSGDVLKIDILRLLVKVVATLKCSCGIALFNAGGCE
jgi:hypothetical protein